MWSRDVEPRLRVPATMSTMPSSTLASQVGQVNSSQAPSYLSLGARFRLRLLGGWRGNRNEKGNIRKHGHDTLLWVGVYM